MIGQLTGNLVEKETTGLIVDVHGVGYEVEVPLSTYYSANAIGESVTLHIHTHVREDALLLYGFSSKAERALFRKLISLSGIGPKLALSILGGIGPSELLSAVEIGNLPAITAIPGVGKKTGERLILELKSSAAALRADLGEAGSPSGPAAPVSVREDVISALENLGFKRPQAEKAITLATESGEESFEELLRKSLKRLTG